MGYKKKEYLYTIRVSISHNNAEIVLTCVESGFFG